VLHHGDCLKVLPALPEKSVDLVVTSPPYNLGINYRSFDDTAGRTEFLEWCKAWATELKRVLADDGSFFLNVGAAPANPLMPHQIILAFKARLEKADNGATKAAFPFAGVQLTAAPYTSVAMNGFELGPEWKMIEIRGTADRNYAPGELKVSIHLATARQTVDFGPVVVLDLGQGG